MVHSSLCSRATMNLNSAVEGVSIIPWPPELVTKESGRKAVLHFPQWNFLKEKLSKFSDLTNVYVIEDLIDDNPDKSMGRRENHAREYSLRLNEKVQTLLECKSNATFIEKMVESTWRVLEISAIISYRWVVSYLHGWFLYVRIWRNWGRLLFATYLKPLSQ